VVVNMSVGSVPVLPRPRAVPAASGADVGGFHDGRTGRTGGRASAPEASYRPATTETGAHVASTHGRIHGRVGLTSCARSENSYPIKSDGRIAAWLSVTGHAL
jgi:hypothetical protein